MKLFIYILVVLIILIFIYNLNKNPKKVIKQQKYSYLSYDGNFKITAKNTYYPKSLKEIQDIIKKSKNRKIRASGGRHTFNDISLSDDIIIRTINLDEVLSINKTLKQVTVESGCTLLKLSQYLEKENLSLPMFPAIPFQTVAGVIGTGSHGSRQDKGSFSSIVIDLTMVLADGTIRKFNKLDEEFQALITSLGCLGVIYSVTIQCEDLYFIEETIKTEKTSEFINKIEDYKRDYNFFQAYIRPKYTYVYLRDKTNNREIVYKKNFRRDVSYKILTKTKNLKLYTEEEIGVPQESINEAINDVLNLINRYKKEKNYNYNHSVLIRFTNKDKSLISVPANRKTSWINLFKDQGDTIGYDFFRDFENLLINKFKGRSHYGKYNFLNESKMLKIYGKININKFKKIRKKLDPNGMFSNKYIYRLLGK